MVIKEDGRYRTIRTKEEQFGIDKHTLNSLNDKEQKLLQILIEQFKSGDTTGLESLHNYRYKYTPVTMKQFLEDPYYLGQSTQTLYPKLKEDLVSLFETSSYREVIFTGSLGFGKTTIGSIIVARFLYELSCFRSPQLSFGMSPKSEITIALLSKTKDLAKKVLLEAVRPRIELSPYFQENFKMQLNKWEFLCPEGIRVVSAGVLTDNVLGMNVFMSVMDELNFLGEMKSHDTGEMIDIASNVYTKLVRRIKSRFMSSGGDLPSFLVLLSSAGLRGSFTDKRIKKVKDDPHAFVRDYATWDVKPSKYGTDTFKVLVGAGSFRSRILKPDEETLITEKWLEETGCDLVTVPEEYREDFKDDIVSAIMDLAGVSVASITPYISRKEKINSCIDDRVHPFSSEIYNFGEPAGFIWDRFTTKSKRRLSGGYEEDFREPLLNPKKLRFVHVDVAVSGDSLGIAMGHIDRWVEVVRRDMNGKEYNNTAPYIIIDFMLKINPPKGEQIFLPDIRMLIYELIANGFKLMGFSADAYQSFEMIQQMKARGIRNSKVVSIDRTMAPYDNLQSAIYEERIQFYKYKPFLDELEKLIHDRTKNKVDHPPKGSKDISDAVAGVVHGLLTNSLTQPIVLTGSMARINNGDENLSWVNEGQILVDTPEKRERASEFIANKKSNKPMPFIIG